MPSVWLSKRGKNYRCFWQTGGPETQKSINCGPLKVYAVKFASQKKLDLYANKLGIDQEPEVKIWETFTAEYLEYARNQKAPRTVKNFDEPALKSFEPIANGHPIHSLTPPMIEEWKGTLYKRGLGPTTIRMWARCVRTAFSYAVKLKYIKENPCKGLPMPRDTEVGKVVTEEQIQAISAVATETLKRPMIFAVNTGLRLGEILGLTWEQVVRPKEGLWRAVIPSGERKPRKPCRVPLNDAARAVMGEPGEGRIFPYAQNSIQQNLVYTRNRLKLPSIRFHDFRHTFATRYLEAGGSPLDLLEMGLWRSLESLKRYAHISDKTLDERISKLSDSAQTFYSSSPSSSSNGSSGSSSSSNHHRSLGSRGHSFCIGKARPVDVGLLPVDRYGFKGR